jgi:outer membrane lipoprotein SlyB
MCIAVLSILTTGCLTTTQKGAIIGTGVGTATGTMIGTFTGNTAMGAAIGAGTGAVGGALVGDHMDQKREEAERAEMQRQLELERKASSGQGKNLIDGHYEYVKKRKKERVWVGGRQEGDRRSDWVDVKIITTPEKEIIKKYYVYNQQKVIKVKKKALPPGLKKKLARGGNLPPGWQKKIIRGEVLDAETYRYAVHVPYDLIKRLPPQPKGTALIKVEGKIVRLLEATGTILDVFDII